MKKLRDKLLQAFKFITDRWSSYVFSMSSIGYGLLLYFNPSLLTQNDAYEFMHRALSFLGGRGLGVIFIVLGIGKLMGTTFNLRKLRLVTLFLLLSLWLMLVLTFGIQFIQGSPNAGWLFTLSIAMSSLNVVFAGRKVM